MTTTTTGSYEEGTDGGGEPLGRAAERLARRIARDARHFAERVEEHVGEFASDVRREWRGWSADAESCRGARTSADDVAGDVGRIFGDVRDVLAAVLDGVDEFIGRVFQGEPGTTWTRVVLNRDVACGGCAKAVPAGQEAFARADGREFRCVDCGPRAGRPGGQG